MEENAIVSDQNHWSSDLQKSWVRGTMEPLLLLVHRLPYPPNKGDKIRSYNLLRYLSGRYAIFLATFIDDPHDWQYLDTVKNLCQEMFVIPINPKLQKIKSVAGLVTGDALTISYYKNRKMKKWCHTAVSRNNIHKAVVFSSSMAQYADIADAGLDIKVVDFVDIDSDKWAQYSESRSWPFNTIYRREAIKLLAYECRIASLFNKSLFVSESESNMFKNMCPNVSDKVAYYNNGVDFKYFSQCPEFHNPYRDDNVIVFTGAMDYWANVHAVRWFATKVLPLIHKDIPSAKFYIVGSNPTDEVKGMSSGDISVTGRVEDIRPYIQYSRAVVAPLQIARGVQNKVLEALSMQKNVVVTSTAAEGLVKDGLDKIVMIHDDPVEFANECVRILNNGNPSINYAGREYVVQNYDWGKNLSVMNELL